MSRRTGGRAIAVLGLGLSSLGCTALSSTDEFQQLSLRAELERLAPGCGECIERQCSSFSRCALTSECVDYAACRAEDISPASYWSCGTPRSDYDALLECSECREACNVGTNWACVGDYTWPNVEAPIEFRQRLLDNEDTSVRRELSGVAVQPCLKADVSCTEPVAEGGLASAVTDEAGWAQVVLPNGEDGHGFDGYLLARGPSVPTFRIHRSTPIPNGEAETALFSTSSLVTIMGRGTVGADIPPVDLSKPQAVFQVLDCLHQPAIGVTVDVREKQASERFVMYNGGGPGQDVNLQGTTFEERGTGAVLNLNQPTDVAQGLVRFELLKDGELLGHSVVTIRSGDITVVLFEPSHVP
ncbi:MAG: hypothetical protein K0R38_4652 [Polyangiaceae bacterium]|nr:hypothetical protein [Polyangiaceae bacterium]